VIGWDGDQRFESYGSPARSSATQVWLTLPRSAACVLRYQSNSAAHATPTTPRPTIKRTVFIVCTNISKDFAAGCRGKDGRLHLLYVRGFWAARRIG
jgi:hypothetical protein